MSTLATSNRLSAETRRNQVLAAAIKLAEKPGGLVTFQRAHVAEKAKCVGSLINHYFGSLDGLREAVVLRGIEQENLAIISQAMFAGFRATRKISDGLKKRAIKHANI